MPHIDENEVLRDALSGLTEEVPPMPEGLHAAWMQKVEDDKVEKTITRKTLTRFLSIAAALVFVVGGTFLTRDDLRADNSDDLKTGAAAPQLANSYDLAEEESAAYDGMAVNGTVYTAATAGSGSATFTRSRSADSNAAAPAAEPAPTEKKIIRTASLTIRTADYDASAASIRALCEADGGWMESSSESVNSRTGLRTAHLTLRIPQSALDGFLAATGDCGRITSRSETATDVTASYQDTQARLATQQALMERLQALIPESATLSDLLALESQIADTQYMIDTLSSSLASTDRQVTYSTVSISLYEETTPQLTDTTVSLGDRLLAALKTGTGALVDFAQDMIVFLVAALPFIGIVVVVVICFMIGRRVARRKKQ